MQTSRLQMLQNQEKLSDAKHLLLSVMSHKIKSSCAVVDLESTNKQESAYFQEFSTPRYTLSNSKKAVCRTEVWIKGMSE
jgi:hypothetical protein